MPLRNPQPEFSHGLFDLRIEAVEQFDPELSRRATRRV
jgi:hypothetical protein